MATVKDHKRSYANYLGSIGGVPEEPANSVAPTISGTAQVGETLTVSNGTWTGIPAPTFTRQWRRGATDIASATGATYVLVAADVGQSITCVVTGTNTAGAASGTSNAVGPIAALPVAPVNTAIPTITGTAQVGATLTVSNGTWSGSPAPTYTRTWSADGTVISGATATTYVPVAGDVGKTITATITATNTAGSASETSAATAAVIAEDDPDEG